MFVEESCTNSVHVRVQRLAGQHVDAQFELTDFSIPRLKSKVEEVWGVPHLCQDIVIGDGVLLDNDNVGIHLADGDASLTVTLLVSNKGLCKLLNEGARQGVALSALAAWSKCDYDWMISAVLSVLDESLDGCDCEEKVTLLEKLSRRDDERVLISMARFLDYTSLRHRCSFTRNLVSALCNLTTPGHAIAIREVMARLLHDRIPTRVAALKVLGAIASRGDRSVIEAVKQHVPEDISPYKGLCHRQVITDRDPDEQVEIATAMMTLAKVAPKGDASVLKLLSPYMSIGWLAVDVVKALGHVTEANDHATIVALAGLLEQLPRGSHPCVRIFVLEVLSDLAPFNIPPAVRGVCSCLSGDVDDEHLHVAAANTLMRISPQGNEFALAALSTRLLRISEYRWDKIAAALVHVAGGPEQAIACVARLLEDPKRQRVVAGVLARFSKAHPKFVVEEITAWLTHEDARTRASAVYALSCVASEGDQGILNVIATSTHDGCPEVCRQAVRAIAALATHGDRHMSEVLRQNLQHNDGTVRLAGIEALLSVATEGDKESCDALLLCTKDEDSFIRQCAVRALAELVQCDDTQTYLKLSHLLLDSCEGVRHEAVQSFSRLAPDASLPVVCFLKDLLDNRRSVVKCASMEALSRMCKSGCMDAFHVLADLLATSKGRRRARVFRLLLDVFQSRAFRTTSDSPCFKIASLMETTNCRHVRKAASKLLISLKTHGGSNPNDTLACSIIPHLHHQKPEVRVLMLHTLAKVAETRSVKILHAVLGLACDVDPAVRSAVSKALALLLRCPCKPSYKCDFSSGPSGNSDCDSDFDDDADGKVVCETVLALLEDSDQKVRESAAFASATIIEEVRCQAEVLHRVVNALSAHLRKPSNAFCFRSCACDFVPGASTGAGEGVLQADVRRRLQDIIAEVKATYGSGRFVGHSSSSEDDGREVSADSDSEAEDDRSLCP